MCDYRQLIRERCLEKEGAFCTSACPFRLDVREFVSRAQRGSFNAAFRTFANAVGFPSIVSALCDEPCKDACPRSKTDAAVELRELERAALAYAVNTKPNNYNLPPKDRRIAIVGGGPSGLACALRLTNKKYAVTLFEKSGRIGGHLWAIMDSEVFLEDIERQFMYETYELVLERKILNPASLIADEKFDAVYVATGADGDDFGLGAKRTSDTAPIPTDRNGVFLGGGVTGAATMEAIAQGLRAANAVEAYLKTGNMRGAPLAAATRIPFDPGVFAYTPPIPPGEGRVYTKEEAVSEANRCIRCQCDACRRHCDMIRHFQKFPKRIEEEVEATVHPGTLDGNGTVATRLIATCNQCGLCAEVCPVGIDTGRFLRQAHQAMREKGAMPWAFHEFWLRDMTFSNSPRASFIIDPLHERTSGYMFFPGCQLGASDPRYVTESYRFLTKVRPDISLFSHCCGAPALWAGDEALFGKTRQTILSAWGEQGKPRAIFACPTCLEIFREHIGEIEGDLLYDVMADWKIEPALESNGMTVSVFDPCASRHTPDTRENIRALVRKAGFELAPLPFEGRFAKCCSFGGQIDVAAPRYAKWLANERISAGQAPYVTYCSNCRDIFADEGKSAYHILDILFALNGGERKPPNPSERRTNRERLRKQMTGGIDAPCETRLLMSESAEKKIHASRILTEDILCVIRHCEHHCEKVLNTEDGHFFGHQTIGNHTLWVEYAPRGEGYELYNAYSHRMRLETEA